MRFSPHVESLISLALAEDLCGGDQSTELIFNGDELGSARLMAKADLVMAGGPIFAYVLDRVARLPSTRPAAAEVQFHVAEGELVTAGQRLASLQGHVAVILQAERLALNLLQHLSGVATATRRFVEILGERISISDTRKTMPGMRELERYAVRVAGGRNHRFNLGSGIMIKDNHIAAAGGIAEAVRRVRARAPFALRIEVEVSSLEELQQALDAKADIIMLDNMSTELMKQAVDLTAKRALLEVSGNVTLERAPELASLGVDFVSCGALTHSVHAADISLRFD
ncbi:MAG: carboxylating nicotinate-nucleotide diphosphorylase [Myxococcota bacterium]|jgi:nicotinate-nucleotide pyrophosphorylase (carboxylating)|nr:carboxylating nicotinate-nucleotide diphosphorylase [Myxococcota bacterium]